MKTERFTKITACLAVAALIISLVPLLLLGQYDLPWSDDFGFAATTHDVWVETGSLAAVLSEAWAIAATRYMSWQGTYAAIFLMPLQPGIWGLAYYAFTPLLLIGSLLFGLWIFVRALGKRVLRISVYERGILFSLTGICMTQFLPSPLEGYYWFNGSILYGFFFALALVFFALFIGYAHRTSGKKRNIAYYALLPALAVFLAGGNYATGLQCALLMAAALCLQFVKKRRDLLLPLVFAVFLACFFANVFAPGNANRVTEKGGALAAVHTGILAIGKTLRVMSHWTSPPLLLAGAAVAPIAWRFSRNTDFRFRFPPLVMIASVLLVATGFMPTLYTIRLYDPERLLDIQFYLCVLLFFVNVFYSVGWLCQHMPEQVFDKIPLRSRRVIAAGFAVLGLAASLASYDAFASFQATKSLYTGEAASYYVEQLANIAILEDPAIQDAVLQPLEHVPRMLTYGFYSSDADHWGNIEMRVYYQKTSVRTAQESP